MIMVLVNNLLFVILLTFAKIMILIDIISLGRLFRLAISLKYAN